MHSSKSVHGIFLVYTCFMALCAILVAGGMFLSPSEPGNAVFLGLSLSRLVLAAGLLLVSVFFLGLFFKGLTDQAWAEATLDAWFGRGRFSQGTAWLAGTSLGLGWIGTFLPIYRAGILAAHWSRIQPLMTFLLPAGIATAAVLLVLRSRLLTERVKVSSTFRLSFLLFLGSAIVLSWMLYSKYGIRDVEDFWYGPGVPLLVSQLIGSVLAGMIFLLVAENRKTTRFDVVIFVLLFLVTAALWANEPLQKSFMFINQRAPNQVFYPFADAATFDAGSQFSLIGQGIFIYNTPFFERTLYLSFLVYLHSLFGQDYEALMMAQAAIFAVFPPLIYLIGRSLDMRAVGFASAVVATMRGINSIAASNMIDLANPKMILTDFPAAIGVALLVLFTCEWLKRPEQKWQYALWAGGAIGLTLMLRTNALVFMPFIPLYALFKMWPRWRAWLVHSILLILAVIAITLPWELRNASRGGVMYGSILTKIEAVIKTRYLPPADAEGRLPGGKVLSSITFQQTGVIASLYEKSSPTQEQACNSIVCFAPKHFIHNVMTTILVLPTSPMLDDLRHVVKESHPYWRADWDGNFTPVSLSLLGFNVFIIVLGINVAWKQRRLQGLAPLAIFVFYNLSNALARTSGGRYIVPMDWILPLYFMIGILFLLKAVVELTGSRLPSLFDNEAEQPGNTRSQSRSWLQAALVLAFLLAAGATVPLAEKLHPARYANIDAQEVLQEQQESVTAAGLQMEQVNDFLENPGAEVLVGRTLYPRSYKLGQGEISFVFYPYTIMDFPRTGFFLIGPNGQDAIVLPGGVPKYLPHAADALVIGCRGENYLDALMVIVLDERGAVYTRSPMSELSCPLKQPVCRNNSSCQ